MQRRFGKLTVKAIGAAELKGTGGVSKADPYCKLRVGSQEFSSRVHSGGGNAPVWGDSFDFDISNEKEIEIEVWDKQAMGNDKLIGSARTNIMAWIQRGEFDGSIDLKDRQSKACGSVKVAAKFQRPQGGQMVPAGPGGMAPPRGMPAPPGAPPMNEAARDPNDKFTDKEIKEAFEAFDLDHNSFVGAAEIRHVLINIGENVTDEEVDEMIRMVDKDGDGQVSFDEFYEMVTGGKRPPPALTGGPAGAMAPPSSKAGGGGGTPVIQQRNARKNALDDFAREYNIKPESIKKAYKRFQETDVDHSGLIEYVEFCEILQVEPSPQVEKLFQLFDKDRSGQIDVKEFMIGLSNFTGAGKEEKLKFAFMVFDDDGNGVITKQELLKILKVGVVVWRCRPCTSPVCSRNCTPHTGQPHGRQ